MSTLSEKYAALKKIFDQGAAKIGLDKLQADHESLTSESKAPDFWSDPKNAGVKMEKIKNLQTNIEPWQKLQAEIKEIGELIDLNDNSLGADIEKQLDSAASKFAELKKQLAYAGPYDNHSAVLNIHAGAGGTDAQDWAEMLMRMYLRWAESAGFKTAELDISSGDEAGIKSASLEIKGDKAYGKLKGEAGVHRLVRLSPFNANNLRQTSFAKVEVLPEIDEPDEVPLDETELKIDVFRAGGHGGQSVNTTDSAVRATHIPTGITVSIQNERSQIQNKETALKILRSKLAALQLEQHAEKISQLKGPNQSAEWGNQIRNYVMHPYTMVKDLRTKQETSDVQSVLDGGLEKFIEAYGEHMLQSGGDSKPGLL